MKRINTTKLMALLASLCLITSSFVGSTLAKYTTSADANDTARVAKWGVVIQADGGLYGKYSETGKVLPTTTSDKASLSVMTSADDKIVAPGTANDTGMNFSVNGTSEVRTALSATIVTENIYLKKGTYAVMVKAPNVTATSFKASTYYTETGGVYTSATQFAQGTTYYTRQNLITLDNDYYPVVYKSSDLSTGTVADDTINNIAADYAAKLNGGTTVTGVVDSTDEAKTIYQFEDTSYDPNYNLSDLGVAAENITWAWDFDANGAGTYDAQDTILGSLRAGGNVVKLDGSSYKVPVAVTDYNLDTNFSIEITVEQVD